MLFKHERVKSGPFYGDDDIQMVKKLTQKMLKQNSDV